jgi:hypothetical protein
MHCGLTRLRAPTAGIGRTGPLTSQPPRAPANRLPNHQPPNRRQAAAKYRLARVVEFWGTLPDDGQAYFVLRPPWVRPDRVATFFALHPEVGELGD